MRSGRIAKDVRSRTGQKGEDLACELLIKKGYKVIQRNYKSSLGEIDIIAREEKTLAFVEVKTRLTSDYGSAKWAVGPQKQRKLSLVALDYLKRHALMEQAARFDVVAIDLSPGEERVELFRNAFDLAY
jgi:putative endonuclease